jgi:hypothetical protein
MASRTTLGWRMLSMSLRPTRAYSGVTRFDGLYAAAAQDLPDFLAAL